MRYWRIGTLESMPRWTTRPVLRRFGGYHLNHSFVRGLTKGLTGMPVHPRQVWHSIHKMVGLASGINRQTGIAYGCLPCEHGECIPPSMFNCAPHVQTLTSLASFRNQSMKWLPFLFFFRVRVLSWFGNGIWMADRSANLNRAVCRSACFLPNGQSQDTQDLCI